MSKITILGSAFAVAAAEQENTYMVIESGNRTVLIDCGDNPAGRFERVGKRIEEVTDLILTHAHADHIGALPLLLMDMWLKKRVKELNLFGLQETLEKAQQMLEIFNWKNWQGMFLVNFIPIEGSKIEEIIHSETLVLSSVLVQHLIPTIGIKASLLDNGYSITYSCDTEPCANLTRLASGSDILIQETAGPGKGHTSPEQAGLTARAAGVRKLIFIHYDPKGNLDEMREQAKKNYSGEIVFARDLMVIE